MLGSSRSPISSGAPSRTTPLSSGMMKRDTASFDSARDVARVGQQHLAVARQ
ncbi:hypothetical protein ACOJBO_32195 [Rhizobium beringeri]